jgi:hypothetical protein
MLTKLAYCEECTIYETQKKHFHNWNKFLGNFYKNYTNEVTRNHIFRCRSQNISENEVLVEFRESLLEEDAPKLINVCKKSWPKIEDWDDVEVAFDHRPDVMKGEVMEVLKHRELNPYKQYEMFAKYRKVVPPYAQEDEIYKEPDKAVMAKVEKEKGMRKKMREDIQEMKDLGDLSAKKMRREDKDKALDILNRIAGKK